MATERAFRYVGLPGRPHAGIGLHTPNFRYEKAGEPSSHAPARPSCTPLNSVPGNSILALEGQFSGSEYYRPRHGGIDATYHVKPIHDHDGRAPIAQHPLRRRRSHAVAIDALTARRFERQTGARAVRMTRRWRTPVSHGSKPPLLTSQTRWKRARPSAAAAVLWHFSTSATARTVRGACRCRI